MAHAVEATARGRVSEQPGTERDRRRGQGGAHNAARRPRRQQPRGVPTAPSHRDARKTLPSRVGKRTPGDLGRPEVTGMAQAPNDRLDQLGRHVMQARRQGQTRMLAVVLGRREARRGGTRGQGVHARRRHPVAWREKKTRQARPAPHGRPNPRPILARHFISLFFGERTAERQGTKQLPNRLPLDDDICALCRFFPSFS